MIDFRGKSALEIIEEFEKIDLSQYEMVEIKIDEQDIEKIGYKSWIDFAQIFYLKMLTPIKENGTIILSFKVLDRGSSFHLQKDSDNEKYGVESEFFNIDKNTLVSFIYHYKKALEFIDIASKQRVLNLGINKGDEFKTIKEMLGDKSFLQKVFIGIDYSTSAIEYAKKSLPYPNVKLFAEDINELEKLELGKFDLIISIGTLQSTNINYKTTLAFMVQELLSKNGSLILAFPNSRWIECENIYGAAVPNYNFNEMGMVVKDIHYAKKYLQQKKFRVTITGKDYLFLTARKIG